MRNILSAIAGLLLVIASLKAIEVGYLAVKVDQNKMLIQRTNRRMAEMYDELRKDRAPCDLMGFDIQEEEQ